MSELSEQTLDQQNASGDMVDKVSGDGQAAPVLHFNLLGRLLGWECILLERGALVIVNKRRAPARYSLAEAAAFPVFKRGFLGSGIEICTEGVTHRFRFLTNTLPARFVEAFNRLIASNIAKQLEVAVSNLDDLVIREYPRDSRVERITKICTLVHERYSRDKTSWDACLGKGTLAHLEKLLSFYPVHAQALREYHERYQLESRGTFLDRVESNPLTLDQRLGVIRSNDRNMVLAAAGTGKTSVIVAKALDIIDRQLASPAEILILAYNRSAAQEVSERLLDKAAKSGIALNSVPEVSTFHALGRMLLKRAGIPTYMSVFADDQVKLKQWITAWLEQYLCESEDRLLTFIELLPEPVNPFAFATQAAYERYVRDNEFRTLNGEKVKGYQELLIANFLYLNSVPYAYEAPYVSKRRIEIGFDYRPDFHLTGGDAYIEHFGVDRSGNTRPDIDAVKYNESIRKKRALHEECGTTLIETFHYEWMEDVLTASLKTKLLEQGIACRPIPPEQVFEKLRSEGRIAEWSELLLKALQAIRVERLSGDLVRERLEKGKISKAGTFAHLLNDLQDKYVQELQKQNAIDFDDMIIRAIAVLKAGQFTPAWKYVLVDEFQDISAARMEFVSAIVAKGPDVCLTVVGDDWQSIYRFSGGKLELTTRFGEMVGPYTSTSLQKTFRYNNSIAKTAGQFIMENPEQYKKDIQTHAQVDESQIYLLDDKINRRDGLCERTAEVVRTIRENDSQGTVAVIARYNYLLTEARRTLADAGFAEGLKFWTFHKSKGLEADYVVLIGLSQGRYGFPNENKDEALVEALLPSLDVYPHSEERRLMYVGLTRARRKVYIIANPSAPSEFVTELLAPKHELNIASGAFKEQYRKIFKCQSCSDGYLKKLTGSYGEFYVCSTGLGCKVRKARVCAKCGAPSIDGKRDSVCNNLACRETIRLCERCGRPMKKRVGRRGEFWGCSGYGLKEDQCTYTSDQ